MKQAIYASVLVFWLSAAALWLAGGDAESTADTVRTAAEPASPAKILDAATVARHASASDCWIIVRNHVYDITAYVPSHPTPPEVITAYCGRDATHAFETKDRGRPHSPYAWTQLERYRVGDIRIK